MLRTLVLATMPPLAAILATATVAIYLGDILLFLADGPAAGWRRLLAIGMLFLPIGLTLAITECCMRRRCRLFGRK